MSKIVHWRRLLSGNNGTFTGTVCGYIVEEKDTTLSLNKTTCKKCLKKSLTKEVRLQMCAGCNEDFYNGNNEIGVKECLHLERAQIVQKKKISVNDVPPWKDQPVVTVLSCRHERGYVFVRPEQEY